MQVIVYPTETGVAVVCPAPGVDVQAVAAKDVPEGKPFVIVEADTLPDRATRDAWQWADFAGEA
jgi:tRNA A37 threonylcarbamoyladenosine synthetase subunit TsaC/SUA5/YrdC